MKRGILSELNSMSVKFGADPNKNPDTLNEWFHKETVWPVDSRE